MSGTDSQPCSSWAIRNAAITADDLRFGRYLATSRLTWSRDSLESISIICQSREHDIQGTDDCHHVGKHVATHHLVERRQVRESRRTDLDAVRLVGAVRDEINTELAFGCSIVA